MSIFTPLLLKKNMLLYYSTVCEMQKFVMKSVFLFRGHSHSTLMSWLSRDNSGEDKCGLPLNLYNFDFHKDLIFKIYLLFYLEYTGIVEGDPKEITAHYEPESEITREYNGVLYNTFEGCLCKSYFKDGFWGGIGKT